MQPQQSYIKDGLVLWMDGIKKGTSQNAWTDLAAGQVFSVYGTLSFGADYVEFDGNSNNYLRNDTFKGPLSGDGTIEIVASDFSLSTSVLFMPWNSMIAFGTFNNIGVVWAADGVRPVALLSSPFKTMSITDGVCLVDGQSGSFDSTDQRYFGGTDGHNYIGKRSSGNAFSGRIHCIRIYSRHLTAHEMLKNQQIDNKRFNLGLNI